MVFPGRFTQCEVGLVLSGGISDGGFRTLSFGCHQGNDEFELTFVLQNLVHLCSAIVSANLLPLVQVVLQSSLDQFEGGGEGGQHQVLGGAAAGGEIRSAPGKMAVCC